MIWLILAILFSVLAAIVAFFIGCRYKDYKDEVKAWDKVNK